MEHQETQQNTSSSPTERKLSIRTVDVIAGLLNRERIDDAVELQLDAITLALEWDMEILDVLELPVDDFIKLYTLPEQFTYPTVRGQWDRVIYGDAAFSKGEAAFR